jgi:Fe-S cluster biogenesis protein NfuA
MIDETEVARALDEAGALIQPDGGAFELVGVDSASGTVSLRLVVDPVECADCILPDPILTEVTTGIFRRSVPGVVAVRIDDPRDPSA